jgi:hypothetical protein
MKEEITVTRNEAKKIAKGINASGVFRDLDKMMKIISGMGGLPYKGINFVDSLSTQNPRSLHLGPAVLKMPHVGRSGLENLQYVGAKVIIEDVTFYEVFGASYKCRYVGPPMEGAEEYINKTAFTDYHLMQTEDAFKTFTNKEEAQEYMSSIKEPRKCLGGIEEDDDANEIYVVGVWVE